LASLFKWTTRKSVELPEPDPSAEPTGAIMPSKVLPKFLAALSHRPAPVLVDLGPVIGQNISFFGDELACKIHVEDLFAEIEAHASGETRGEVGAVFEARLAPLEPGSVDGILCWELFDYLDRVTGAALAKRLASLLAPGGTLYGFFGTAAGEIAEYRRFVVQDRNTLRVRAVPARSTKRHVLVTRDINRMFEGLVVAESVLLKSSTREALFRRPQPHEIEKH
jgi:hypothetical protein